MEIRILQEKKLIPRKDVHSFYEQKGAVIFYEVAKNNGAFWLVYAEADYIQNGNGVYWQPLSGEYECLNGMKRMAIKPQVISKVSVGNLRIMQSEYIYQAEMKGQISDDFYQYKKIRKNLSKEDMEIYYYEDRMRNAIAYFGTSIAPDVDIVALREQSHMDVTTMSYKDYLWEVNLYNSRPTDTSKKVQKPKGVTEEIKAWVESASYGEFEQAIGERIIGQPELSIVLASVYSYLSAKANGEKAKFDVLLAAPSGCGKTETFRALRDYFKDRIPSLPLSQVDMTQVTEEGYKGKNTNSIISVLLDHTETNGVGIIWLDEFDKS